MAFDYRSELKRSVSLVLAAVEGERWGLSNYCSAPPRPHCYSRSSTSS